MRTQISYSKFVHPLLLLTGFPQSRAWVEVGTTVKVRMSWGFQADIPLASVQSAHRLEGRRPISIGVHGWRGRWLVNGSRDGLVIVTFAPPVRARVIGFPVKLKELAVSVDDPDALIDALLLGKTPSGGGFQTESLYVHPQDEHTAEPAGMMTCSQ